MSILKRGGVYWYEFIFRGGRIQQSTGLHNKNAAVQAEAIRRAELAEGRAAIRARKATPLLKNSSMTSSFPGPRLSIGSTLVLTIVTM